MQLSDRRYETEMTNERPCGFIGARFRCCPIHVFGVEYGVSELIDEWFTVHRLEKAGIAPLT
jgi:hypothetical protein